MGWGIALGILALLAVLPLTVSVRYDASGAAVSAGAGGPLFRIYPRKKKEKKIPREKEKQDTKNEKAPPPGEQTTEPRKQTQEQPAGGTQSPAEGEKKAVSLNELRAYLPLLEVVRDLLDCLRRKLRVRRLYLRVILAGEDKAALAKNYGYTWAAVGNLYPMLERFFIIQKRDVEIECDFAAEKPIFEGELIITLTLGRLLAIAVVYGIRGLRRFLRIRKNQKGGAGI